MFFKYGSGLFVLRVMARPCRQFAKAHVAEFAAQRRLGDRDPELFPSPPRQIDEAPAHDTMDGWDWASLHDLPQCLALAIVENTSSARRLAVQQTIGTLGVEPKHPIAHNLQPDTADPGRIGAGAAIIDLRKCHPSTGSGDGGSDRDRVIAAQAFAAKQRQSPGEAELEPTWQTSQKLFAMVNQTNADSGIPA